MEIIFTGRNVTIKELAKATGKSEQYWRSWIQTKECPIGYAIKVNGSSTYSYYLPDKQVYEYTGYYNPNPEEWR